MTRFLSLGNRSILVPLFICPLFMCTALVAGCGGGGGDDDDGGAQPVGNVLFSGTVQSTDDTATARPLPGTMVCALGVCDDSDENGSYSFTVPAPSYDGGDVAFDLNGPEVQAQVTVGGLDPDSRDIQVIFSEASDGAVSAISVVQDGTSATPLPPDETDEEEPEPLSADPQERACQILRRTNITITNVSSPVVHQADEECPEQIDTLLAVGNIHPITFDYEILFDVPDLAVDEATGRVSQGQLNRHDGSYLCTREESFTATVTARIVRYFPEGFDPITREEAIAACGREANIGNTDDTRAIEVQVAAPPAGGEAPADGDAAAAGEE